MTATDQFAGDPLDCLLVQVNVDNCLINFILLPYTAKKEWTWQGTSYANGGNYRCFSSPRLSA